MPWACRMIPAPGAGPGDTPWKELRVGDMWLAPYLLERQGSMFYPAAKYHQRNAGRPPLVVRLPGPVDWGVDGPAWKGGQPYGDGWDVSGDPPLVTVSPSINISGIYHGWLQNGVISDDCEGRRYDPDGRLQRP
jgi:hypothetical protein